MEAFCGSPFWDYNLTINTDDPDLTSCFQNTVLVWTPCIFLALSTLYSLYFLMHSQKSYIPWTWLNITKTVFGCVLVLLALANLCNAVYISATGGAYAVTIVSPGIIFLAMCWATSLIQMDRKKGFQSSGPLFLYWLLWTIADIFICASKIRYYRLMGEPEDVFTFVIFFIHFPVVILQLILSVFVDDPPAFSEIEDQKQCPDQTASFLSKISFWWITGLIIRGYRKPLEKKDLWSPNKENTCRVVVPQFTKHWEEELLRKCSLPDSNCCSGDKEAEDIPLQFKGGDMSKDIDIIPKQDPSLLKPLFKAFGRPWAFSLLGDVAFVAIMLTGPQWLRLLISFTADPDEPMWKGFMYAGLLFLSSMSQSLIMDNLHATRCIVGFRMRTAATAAVYRKALALSNGARKSTTVGEIVNLMSVDTSKFDSINHCFSFFVRCTLEILCSLISLWLLLGPSVLAGVAVMIVLIPINTFVAKRQKKLQRSQMKHKDTRIKLMNEILNGIKVLKLYAWELSFQEKVKNIREKEIRKIKKSSYVGAIGSFSWDMSPYLVSLVTFGAYLLSSPDHVLTAEKAFVALTLFNIMSNPLTAFPHVINHMIQVNVSLKRISDFLTKEELDPKCVDRAEMKDNAIVLKNGTFTWDKGEVPILKSISMEARHGQLVAVVGSVGAGKSSLLSALLGDMDKIDGTVKISGSVAYVPQQAWIQNCSFRDNIVFNNPPNDSQYKKIIENCALTGDLEILPSADRTEIGEKGINLSGGQKQRVSLARAVYSDADIYFLDDPLSAVDAHVGKHIFQHVIGPEGMLKDKTRILVTHGINYLSKVDKIIVLSNGSVSECGTYDELMARQGAFSEFLKNYLLDEEKEEELEDGDETSQRNLSPRNKTPRERTFSDASSKADDHNTLKVREFPMYNRQVSEEIQELEEELCESPESPESEPDTEQVGEKLIKDEETETGSVKWSVFATYFKAIGLWMSTAIMFLLILEIALSIGSSVWLSRWSDDPIINGTTDPDLRDLRLGVYGTFGAGIGLTVVAQSLTIAVMIILASRKLHAGLLANILRCPQTFFDTTPTGRITNRFAKDIDNIDQTIPHSLIHFFFTAINTASSIIVVSLNTPLVLCIVVPLAVVYYLLQRIFIPSMRQIKRIESVASSPIYSHFGETLSGVSMIRAFRQQKTFISQSDEKVDHHAAIMYHRVMANRWLATRLQFIGNCIVFFAAIFAVTGRDVLTAGIVGLSVSYAMKITGGLGAVVHVASELEANVVSLERVKEYSSFSTEAEWSLPEKKPEPNWPQEGNIVIDNYSTTYREGLPLVVKDINCNIKGGEKIGIVGRTGAGKSSLTLALFRIIEPAAGKIVIDGVDISEIGLHDLRSKITVIPQDPVLFSGSLRMNLDPFDQYTDQELWTALEHAHLKNFVASNSEGLLFECAEGGENMSVGQRQLLCLARALLRKTKVLVLDEATAAVDMETDDLIQSTIRTEFADCTVLTIAHRLNTIMDYTRILVLQYGEVKEFAPPQELLQDQNGIFYSMAKEAGLVS